jgi:hypothetical protein
MTATEKRSAAIVVESILEIDKKVELIGLLKYSRGVERVWIMQEWVECWYRCQKLCGAMLMEECRAGLDRMKSAVAVARLVGQQLRCEGAAHPGKQSFEGGAGKTQQELRGVQSTDRSDSPKQHIPEFNRMV